MVQMRKASKIKPLLLFRRFVQNQIPFLQKNFETYGDTHFFGLHHQRSSLFTIDPDVIQHVLRKNADNYEKEAESVHILSTMIGQGLLISDGAYHDRQRKLIQPAFHRKVIARYIDLMNTGLAQWLAENKGKKIEVVTEMRKLSFDLMLRAILGNEIDKPFVNEVFHHFHALQHYFGQIVRFPRLKRFYDLIGKTKTAEFHRDAVIDSFKNFIAKRRAAPATDTDFLSYFMSTTYEDTKEGMSDTQVLEEVLTLLVAGHETATHILSWLVYTIGNEKAVADGLKKEFSQLNGAPPTFQDLQDFAYLNCVIEETLRLYPPSWTTARIAKAIDTYKDIKIDKGTRVIIFIYGLHHNASFWPNSDVFQPMRFEPETKKKQHPYAYMPFGSGPRMCIGRNFALLMLQSVVFHFFQENRVQLQTLSVGLSPSLTLQPDRPIFATIH
jgi:cytochrome P450